MGGKGVFWAIVYIVFGAYFVNKGILYYDLTKYIGSADQWITLLGGILIFLGGINHFRISNHKRKSQ